MLEITGIPQNRDLGLVRAEPGPLATTPGAVAACELVALMKAPLRNAIPGAALRVSLSDVQAFDVALAMALAGRSEAEESDAISRASPLSSAPEGSMAEMTAALGVYLTANSTATPQAGSSDPEHSAVNVAVSPAPLSQANLEVPAAESRRREPRLESTAQVVSVPLGEPTSHAPGDGADPVQPDPAPDVRPVPAASAGVPRPRADEQAEHVALTVMPLPLGHLARVVGVPVVDAKGPDQVSDWTALTVDALASESRRPTPEDEPTAQVFRVPVPEPTGQAQGAGGELAKSHSAPGGLSVLPTLAADSTPTAAFAAASVSAPAEADAWQDPSSAAAALALTTARPRTAPTPAGDDAGAPELASPAGPAGPPLDATLLVAPVATMPAPASTVTPSAEPVNREAAAPSRMDVVSIVQQVTRTLALRDLEALDAGREVALRLDEELLPQTVLTFKPSGALAAGGPAGASQVLVSLETRSDDVRAFLDTHGQELIDAMSQEAPGLHWVRAEAHSSPDRPAALPADSALASVAATAADPTQAAIAPAAASASPFQGAASRDSDDNSAFQGEGGGSGSQERGSTSGQGQGRGEERSPFAAPTPDEDARARFLAADRWSDQSEAARQQATRTFTDAVDGRA